MPYSETAVKSKNYSSGVNECKGLVLHHTGDYHVESIINTFTNPATQASAHVLICKDGTRYVFGDDSRIMWHAGRSSFNGREWCNAFMLGVEFEGDTYKAPLTPQQLDSLIEWLAPRAAKYGWKMANITDHRTISPGRKTDLEPAQYNAAWLYIADKLGLS